MWQTGSATRTRRIFVAALMLFSCAGPSDIPGSVFQICENNLRSVRGTEAESGDISRIELILTAAASRDFALFTKANYGADIEIKAGEFRVMQTKVLGVIRGGRVEIVPPEGRGQELLERLMSPPPAPCGPAS